MITRDGKKYVCKLDWAFEIIRGKWKAVILCHLLDGTKRFLELQRITSGVSHKVLNEKLRELENSGLICKKTYNEYPPKVEYYLTNKGFEYAKVLKEIEFLGEKYF
ncbi:helix-turn-helix domain-containing protein [Romboutsia sedimentorum]|uniref:Helix-turn-helix domain-containing protein n=1 Tax=Romboutsia sedimentorum TaxID=1368474 RepID=A0ABT7EAQ2_9FIRM|nr:helix-turn-helix domain-containing protein [Romboutsia sedimentorum]MDK2564003.1 helix-turn-helix domain-containing protein [Romboutsia sedimentorum]MDK2585544.1 helix-turn-helix domain-containing protein [Romboutsia sedimentorum]